MSDAKQPADDDPRDIVREEHGLDIAAFRRFVFSVSGLEPDEADIMEASMAAADRIDEISEALADHDERLQIIPAADGGGTKPDDRAVRLRQILMNRLSRTDRINDEVARLRRDNARDALGGDLHKSRVLDAMRRAADGREADIGDGSSQLEPVDAITFHVGGAVNADKAPEQSRLELDSSGLTDSEARQILTTGSRGEGP